MDQTRTLGKTKLEVKRIGFGANAVGGHNLFPNLNDETGKDLVRTALDGGVNFIDTAFIYGLGRSEELIGEVVQERGVRNELIIATKGAHKEVDGSIELDNSREFLRSEVEKSLKRLKTDYIDLYYVHFPDGKTPLAEVAGTLKELKDEGKIKAIGASNLDYQQLQDFNADGYLEVFQAEYSLIQRDAEKELLPYCEKQGISFIPYFPLASGLLTGKFTKDTVFEDFRKDKPQFQGETFSQHLKKVDKLKAVAEEKQVETAHLALAWLLTRPAIDAIIPGAKRPEQLKENLKTLNIELTEDEANFISGIFT
ncbi:aldo/keto reductase [Bacillus subtilis]|uniref:aldo/keto reductase n=1 Tax=Bacillus subtilis TaxID=1423 RepID=UPI00089DFA50|nr:aldo/keto reductase [Bacillus subtilis]AOY05930.1 oxidoreductase [Bacillus subtilis]